MGRALLCLALCIASGTAGAAPPVSVDEALGRMGFPDDARASVMAGHFVEVALDPTSDQDLALALAFLVKIPPSKLGHDMIGRSLLFTADSNTLADGALEGEAADAVKAQLKDVELTPAERTLYAGAKPGFDTNFSGSELSALTGAARDTGSIDTQVRDVLRERYLAYRSKGLEGLPPYDRGDGATTDIASDLRSASKAAARSYGFPPDVSSYLLDFPDVEVAPTLERFHWSSYLAHGEPVLILTHTFSVAADDVVVYVQRQFYVSRGYDVEQAISQFMPVREGTLVLYTNHSYTDQIAGVGGRFKRNIGERVMASQLKDLYDRIRGEVQPK